MDRSHTKANRRRTSHDQRNGISTLNIPKKKKVNINDHRIAIEEKREKPNRKKEEEKSNLGEEEVIWGRKRKERIAWEDKDKMSSSPLSCLFIATSSRLPTWAHHN